MRARLAYALLGSALGCMTWSAQAGAQTPTSPPAPPPVATPVRDTMTVSVAEPDPIPDAELVPERLRGFRSRKGARRDGYFFELAQIQSGNNQRLSEVIRQVPGVRLVGSASSGSAVRLRGCRPLVWVDGVRQIGLELDESASINDISAVEVYVSQAAVPAEFRDHRVGCGAILLWSRS